MGLRHPVETSTAMDVSTGWRRPVGCLKLQVIFRKRATNYRALLRKMTALQLLRPFIQYVVNIMNEPCNSFVTNDSFTGITHSERVFAFVSMIPHSLRPFIQFKVNSQDSFINAP